MHTRKVAAGKRNYLADHVAMFPIYSYLGYSTEHFLGPSRSLNELERRVDTDLRQMGERLKSPQAYLDSVSQYLERNEIRFKPLNLTSAIIAQRS
jgi:hypothetical protein